MGINNFRLTLTNDQAYDLIIEIATGDLDDIPTLAGRIGPAIEPRTCRPLTWHSLFGLRPTLDDIVGTHTVLEHQPDATWRMIEVATETRTAS